MKHYDLLVIGGDAAGMSAASQARRINSDMSIGVFNKGTFVSYAACGMPYMISDDVSDYKKLIAINKDDFIEKRKIEIVTEAEVTAVDFKKKNVTVTSKSDENRYSFEKLIIATGAHSMSPPINGIDIENVFTLRTLNDGISIREFINNKSPKKAVIIGGGFIGLEMAEAFHKKGIETVLLEKMESVAMTMSPFIREKINTTLIDNGIMIKTGISIDQIEKPGISLNISTDDGTFDADLVLVSAGIAPSTDFLKNTGLAMNDRGAIIIDEKSRTNLPGVYAAGDCATVKNIITGKDVYFPLGTTANKQGRVAGLQAAGVDSEHFRGIVGSQFVKIFDLEVGKTGFNAYDAEKEGIPFETDKITWHSRAGYYPLGDNIYVTLTINSKTREVIGGEVAGTDNAVLRTDTIATAVAAKMTVEDLAYLDLGYAPPFSPVWDPVNAVAQKFIKRKL